MRKVVITGMGIACPIGVGKLAVLEAIRKLRIEIGPITSFDASNLPVRIAAEIKNLNPEDFIDKKLVRRTDRFVHLALIAAKEALEESRINLNEYSERTAVLVASGMGGFITLDTENNKFIQFGSSKVSPFLIPMLLINMASGIISIENGVKGINFAPVSACAASGHAIALGALLIKHGYADVAIAGGSEATIAPLPIAGFASMKALSTRNDEPTKASRPFDIDRDGFVMGEGAGILILEAEEVAKSRGANIIAEVKGFGMNSDAYHMSAPDPNGEGAEKAIRLALKNAQLSPEDIQYVSCHATSTPAGDVAEAKAIERVFGDKVLINSSKTLMGHLLGAAAVAETIVGVLEMQNGFVHGMPNLDNKDPEVRVNVVGKENVTCEIENFVKNSFGFGGHNVSLVIGRYRG